MTHSDSFPAPFRLRDCLVQPDLNRVSGPDGEHRIEPRVMRVLLALAERAGTVVPRQHLLDEVWGDAVVGEEILTRAVSELRRAFGDDPRRPTYIETIRQHGYRLIAPYEAAPRAAPAPVVPDMTPNAVPARPAPPSTLSAPRPAGSGDAVTVGRQSRSRGWWAGWLLLAAVLAALSVMTIRFIIGGRSPVTEGMADRPPAATPLTSFVGREWHPALAPDGSRVAFVWTGEDGRQPGVYVKQRNSERPLQLSDEAGWPAWPVWSPEGQSVAFAQTDDSGSSICIVPSLGGAVQRLHEVPGLIEGLDWAPDGRAIVFAARADGMGPYRLQLLDLDNRKVTAVEASRSDGAARVQPRFSPDGRLLAWIEVGPAGDGAIAVGPAAGGAADLVMTGLASLEGLAWTPDSAELVYAAAPAGRYDLWRIDAAGGAPRWVPTPGSFAWNPAVARETGDLVYEEVRVDQDIWRVVVTQSDPLQLQTGPFLTSTRWEYGADFSPDGTRIVFVSARAGRPELWLADASGESLQRLTFLETTAITHPRWSPDGRSIAFNAAGARGTEVMIVSARGGTPRTVVPPGERTRFSAWTNDGQSLLVSADRGDGWQIRRLDLDGGDDAVVTRQGGLAAMESPDGAFIYHTRPDSSGIWRVPLGSAAGTMPELVVGGLDPIDRENWRVLDGWIAWIMRSGGTAFLMRYDIGSEQIGFLAELPRLAGAGLAVAPGGGTFLYPRTSDAAGDLMLLPAGGW